MRFCRDSPACTAIEGFVATRPVYNALMPEKAPSLDFNPEFRKALETMEGTSRNLLLTGRAGTGKSTLLRYFRDHTKKNAAVLAPTGVAALNVEGETIHSFFRFRTDVTPEKVKRARDRDLYAKLDAIVIDEVSMVRADLMDCIDAFLRLNGRKPGKPFGGVQVILIGDLYQLPPIVTSSDREAFRSRYPSPFFFDARSYAGLDCGFIELQKVYRQHDQGFIAVLNAIRNNIITPEHMAILNGRVCPDYEPPPDERVVCLTPFNKAADEINARRLAALPGKESVFRADTSGKAEEKSLPAPLELAVKPGAQVMMVNNDSMGRWVNGTLARVTRIVRHGGEPDEIAVELGDGPTARVGPHTWKMFRYVWNRAEKRLDTEPVGSYTQYPMRLAWAVTIHKAQGKTFDKVVVDMGRGAFAAGQTYVALSRCTTLEGLVLKRPLGKRDVFTDWRIVKFVTGRHYDISERAMPMERKLDAIREAIRARAPIEIIYLKSNDTRSRRTVTPLEAGTMEYKERPFQGMRAMCHLRREERIFRIDRILEMRPATPVSSDG